MYCFEFQVLHRKSTLYITITFSSPLFHSTALFLCKSRSAVEDACQSPVQAPDLGDVRAPSLVLKHETPAQSPLRAGSQVREDTSGALLLLLLLFTFAKAPRGEARAGQGSFVSAVDPGANSSLNLFADFTSRGSIDHEKGGGGRITITVGSLDNEVVVVDTVGLGLAGGVSAGGEEQGSSDLQGGEGKVFGPHDY